MTYFDAIVFYMMWTVAASIAAFCMYCWARYGKK